MNIQIDDKNKRESPDRQFIAEQTTVPVPAAGAATQQGKPSQHTSGEVQSNKRPAGEPATASAGESQKPEVARPARRMVIIRPEKKRKKGGVEENLPVRHINPRLRQSIILLTIALVLMTALGTLIPLSTGQNRLAFFNGLSTFIQSNQANLQFLSQQTPTPTPIAHAAPMTLPRSEYVTMAEQDANNVGISPLYFERQINLESGFNPNAVSPSGAVGIAQFMPSTAAGLGIDPWDPAQALQAAAQMMANSYHQYGDYAKALAAYNAGSANLQHAVDSCGANWLSCMPGETQHYIAVIMA